MTKAAGSRNWTELKAFGGIRGLLSVVTVCRNALPILPVTIESVLNQRDVDVELVVIDGNSSDGTHNYLMNLDSGRIRYISEPDAGIFDAMNKGIRIASGEVITFLNAGDYYCSETVLSKVMMSYFKLRWNWAYGFARLQINFRKVSWKQRIRQYSYFRGLYMTQMCHQATFYRSDLFTRIGTYRTNCGHLADYDLSLRAANVAAPVVIREHLVWYDVTGVSGGCPSIKSWRLRYRICVEHAPAIVAQLALPFMFVRMVRSLVGYFIKRLYAKVR